LVVEVDPNRVWNMIVGQVSRPAAAFSPRDC
jgi:hypothetical protein